MKKLTDSARKLHTFFKVADSVLMALPIATAVIVCLIGAGWILGWNPDTMGTGYENLDLGFFELTVADACAPDKWLVLLQAAITLVLSAVFVLVARVGVRAIRNILLSVMEGKPFDHAVSGNLHKLGVLSIVLGLIGNLISLVEVLFATFVLGVPEVLVSEKIIHVGVNYTMDISFLIISAVLFLLSYIFRYGCELQQLSDETL